MTADGQIEYAGRFVGEKGADCDVGSLSRIVMHLGSGIDHEGRPEQMFKMPYHRGTRAPFFAAEMAAHAPAGPPPATSTSTS